jgi:hypothetical protein
MTMRFQPADIRVINRRICLLPYYLLCRSHTSFIEENQPGSTPSLDKVASY